MPKAAELAELHHLIGNMRRCVTALQDRYGDAPAMRRVMIDTDRILGDLDILEMDAGELEHAAHIVVATGEKVSAAICQY